MQCAAEEVPVALHLLEASVSLDYRVDDIFGAKERGRTKQRICSLVLIVIVT